MKMKGLLGHFLTVFLTVAVLLGFLLRAEAVPFNPNNFYSGYSASTNSSLTSYFRSASFTSVYFGQGGALHSPNLFSQLSFQNITCPLCQSVNVLSLNVLRLTGGPGGFSLYTGTYIGISNSTNHINNAVPIPGTLLLFGAGFAGLIAWQRRHSRREEPLV